MIKQRLLILGSLREFVQLIQTANPEAFTPLSVMDIRTVSEKHLLINPTILTLGILIV